MGTIISADGYALTNTHVIDQFKAPAVLLPTWGKSRIQWHMSRPIVRGKHGKETLLDTTFIVPYGTQDEINEVQKLDIPTNTHFIQEVRIVKRFPLRDFAIIKIPITEAKFFPIANKWEPEEVAYASGNGISDVPGNSAGHFNHSIGKNRIIASIPQTQGDSGGPIFNTNGELIGITSMLWPQWGMRKRFLQNSILIRIHPDEIKTIIRNDRVKQKHGQAQSS